MKHQRSQSEQKQSSIAAPRLGPCVEVVLSIPTFIEFITVNRLWGIPARQLEFFVLGSNQGMDGKKPSPPDILVLVFKTRLVFLFGWRLEQMLDPLMQGRVKRVHAEKFPSSVMTSQPWVSAIVVAPRFATIPL